MVRCIPIFLLGLCLRVLPADAGVMNVCNEGNVTLSTAIVEHSNSGYRVSGWYPVPAGKCEEVFHTSFANLFLGFAYRDANKALRAHASLPSKRDYDIYDISETFCVKIDGTFEYESRERPATTCRAGYAPLTFSVFVRLSNVAVAWYTSTPHLNENGHPLGRQTGLLLGRPVVAGENKRWYFNDGSLAFQSVADELSDAFFDLRRSKRGSVSPADLERFVALSREIDDLLKPAGVRFNALGFDNDHGRLCFERSDVIRCANQEALDFNRTTVSDSGVSFYCRTIMPCVLIATPLREGAGKVKLAGREMSLTPPQSALVVSSLPNRQVARALADKIRDRSDIVAKYTETVR